MAYHTFPGLALTSIPTSCNLTLGSSHTKILIILCAFAQAIPSTKNIFSYSIFKQMCFSPSSQGKFPQGGTTCSISVSAESDRVRHTQCELNTRLCDYLVQLIVAFTINRKYPLMSTDYEVFMKFWNV